MTIVSSCCDFKDYTFQVAKWPYDLYFSLRMSWVSVVSDEKHRLLAGEHKYDIRQIRIKVSSKWSVTKRRNNMLYSSGSQHSAHRYKPSCPVSYHLYTVTIYCFSGWGGEGGRAPLGYAISYGKGGCVRLGERDARVSELGW